MCLLLRALAEVTAVYLLSVKAVLTAYHVKLIRPDTLRLQALAVRGVKHKPRFKSLHADCKKTTVIKCEELKRHQA